MEKLHTSYHSYGLLGGMDYTKYTEDKEYKLFPIGRLINVRIEHYADDDEYEILRKALESHYSGDSRVNQVYRNQGGTIMIDCRN
ncbi:MAG: ABC transporter [Bacteroidales bacterium]|nr:ABC transporter [Bacteroidales bacterium]